MSKAMLLGAPGGPEALSGEEVADPYRCYLEHVETDGHDEQAADRGHLRYGIGDQKILHEASGESDHALVKEHRNT